MLLASILHFTTGQRCIDSGLQIVSNKAVMRSNGWIIDTSNNIPSWQKVFNDRSYCGNANTFYGFKAGWEIGRLSATFKGRGRARLDFGNCAKRGCTKVFLNNRLIAKVGPKVSSKVITFYYTPGSVLTIQEHYTGIIKLNTLKLECGSSK